MRAHVFLVLVVLAAQCARVSNAGWWGSDDADSAHHHHDDHHHHHDDEIDPDIVQVVTCGSAIKLKHATGYRLHSHQVSYGSGSGQQSVTTMANSDDNNSLWVVRGGHGKKRCRQGAPVKNGDIIRLQHLTTKLNLHSHLHASPLSKQQEVSCFGPEGNGDSSDNWRVQVSTPVWQRGKEVEFQHVDTEHYLHSHNVKFKHPIPGQQEVTCFPHKNENTKWSSVEGIYFPERKDKDVGKIEEDKLEVEGESEGKEEPEPTLDIDE